MSELWGLWGPLPTWDGVKGQSQYLSTDAGSLRACLLGPPVLSQPRRAVPESGQVPALPGDDRHSPMLLPAAPGASPSSPPTAGWQHTLCPVSSPCTAGAGEGEQQGAVLEPPSPSPPPLSPSPPRPLVSMYPLTNLPARSKASVPTPSPREGPGGQGLGGAPHGQDSRLISGAWMGRGQSPSLLQQPNPHSPH